MGLQNKKNPLKKVLPTGEKGGKKRTRKILKPTL